MTIAILGLILLVVGFTARRNVSAIGAYRGLLLAAGALLVVLGIALSTVIQIDAGEVGVQTLFGQVQKRVLPSGLNLVNPLVEVTRFDTKTQNYTMSAIQTEGQQAGDDAIRVLSADGLEVVIDLTALYHVMPTETPRILSTIGGRLPEQNRAPHCPHPHPRQRRVLRRRGPVLDPPRRVPDPHLLEPLRRTSVTTACSSTSS